MSQVWRRTFAGVLCGAAVSVAMAATGCGTDETESEIRATEGTEVTLPPLPYGTKGDRESDVVIGSDGRCFAPWAYAYHTVAQSEIGCTATMVGRMAAVMAGHPGQDSTGSRPPRG